MQRTQFHKHGMRLPVFNIYTCTSKFNSLVPGGYSCNDELSIFKLTQGTDILSIACEFALRWMPPELTIEKSTLVQVIAWCCQATSYYLSQCWQGSISPYGVTRPQLVKVMIIKSHGSTLCHWKLESYHGANFVDDKVGIMATLCFQWYHWF